MITKPVFAGMPLTSGVEGVAGANGIALVMVEVTPFCRVTVYVPGVAPAVTQGFCVPAVGTISKSVSDELMPLTVKS